MKPAEEMGGSGGAGEVAKEGGAEGAADTPAAPSLRDTWNALVWHGGSVYDAWINAVAAQVPPPTPPPPPPGLSLLHPRLRYPLRGLWGVEPGGVADPHAAVHLLPNGLLLRGGLPVPVRGLRLLDRLPPQPLPRRGLPPHAGGRDTPPAARPAVPRGHRHRRRAGARQGGAGLQHGRPHLRLRPAAHRLLQVRRHLLRPFPFFIYKYIYKTVRRRTWARRLALQPHLLHELEVEQEGVAVPVWSARPAHGSPAVDPQFPGGVDSGDRHDDRDVGLHDGGGRPARPGFGLPLIFFPSEL